MSDPLPLSQAVILSGGLGTRLASVATNQIPKSLAEVQGRPFLEYQLKLLSRNRINKVLLLTGYLGEQIEAMFGTGEALNMSLSYSCESSPMGTGGALVLAYDKLPEVFFLINGDTYLDFDYQQAALAFGELKDNGPLGLMVVRSSAGVDDLGNVKLDSREKKVVSYSKGKGDDHAFIDAGVLILTKSVINWLPKDQPSGIEHILFPKMATDGCLLAFPVASTIYDIGTPDRLAVFQTAVLQRSIS